MGSQPTRQWDVFEGCDQSHQHPKDLGTQVVLKVCVTNEMTQLRACIGASVSPWISGRCVG